jgi:hypothetical protein
LPLSFGCHSWRRRCSLRARSRFQVGHHRCCRWGHQRASPSIRGRASTDTAPGGTSCSIARCPFQTSCNISGCLFRTSARHRRDNPQCPGGAFIVAPVRRRRNHEWSETVKGNTRGQRRRVRPILTLSTVYPLSAWRCRNRVHFRLCWQSALPRRCQRLVWDL